MAPLALKRGASSYIDSKRARKTVTKKKGRRPSLPVQVRIGRQPVPQQFFNTLTYVENLSRTVTGGVTANYQFSCNGMFDPNQTGTGHQPQYFDIFAAMYDHYTVLRSRFKVEFAHVTTLPSPFIAVLYIDDDTTMVTTNASDQAAEQYGAVSKMIMPGVDGVLTLFKNWDATKTFGPTPQAQDDLQGTSVANPVEAQYFTLVVEYPSGDTTTLILRVTIEYDCVWDEFKTQAKN